MENSWPYIPRRALWLLGSPEGFHMSRPFKNNQEVLLNELACRSMAAPFVFAPDVFKKGKNSEREPADLVWACNNCVILMYMTESRRSADDAIKHNLNQAKGWLKEWKNGRRLTGSNRWRGFSIKYGQALYVIVLSIIKHHGVAVFYEEKAKELGVTCCATLPQSAIQFLTAMGGSSLDLMLVLKGLRDAHGARPIDENAVREMIFGHRGGSLELMKFDSSWPGVLSPARLNEVLKPILNSRRQAAVVSPCSPAQVSIDMDGLQDVLNDICLAEFYRLAADLRHGVDIIGARSSPSHSLLTIRKLFGYDCALCLMPDRKHVLDLPAYFATLFGQWRKWYDQVENGGIRWGPWIALECNQRSVSVATLKPRPMPSTTEKLLEKWDEPLLTAKS